MLENKLNPPLHLIREALEASWCVETSYGEVSDINNPALGQCYPTSRVIQHFYPETEIVQGQVKTRSGTETHFWNLLESKGYEYHIDLTWQQFPYGTVVKEWEIRRRDQLGDSGTTITRVNILLARVEDYLSGNKESMLESPSSKTTRFGST